VAIFWPKDAGKGKGLPQQAWTVPRGSR